MSDEKSSGECGDPVTCQKCMGPSSEERIRAAQKEMSTEDWPVCSGLASGRCQEDCPAIEYGEKRINALKAEVERLKDELATAIRMWKGADVAVDRWKNRAVKSGNQALELDAENRRLGGGADG